MENTNDFTIRGFNDKPSSCLQDDCKGYVTPTHNANIGICDTCGERYNWGQYWKEFKEYKKMQP